MSDFVKALKTSELEDGEGRCVELAGQKIAIFKHDGSFFALEDVCPHAGASLSEGYLTDGCVRCPWHAADFDLRTGQAKTPPAYDPVQTYAVRINGDDLEVQVQPLPEGAA